MSRHEIAARNARAAVDRELGMAARALESAAESIEELRALGIEYPANGPIDALTVARTLSQTTIELQVNVRKANHEA
jgi:hypothetical protein